MKKLSQYERICKITQKHFFFKRQKKKKTDMDMFLEMKLTTSLSTEDGVKTSQMLWGIQLQNAIKPWVAPLKKGIDFPVTQYMLQTSKSSKTPNTFFRQTKHVLAF